MTHISFAPITRGPNWDLSPMRLCEKARGQSVDQVDRAAQQFIETVDA